MRLDPPLKYFPLEDGRYRVQAGLRLLPEFSESQDRKDKVFQFDQSFGRYRQNKVDCRKEDIRKYYCALEQAAEKEQTIALWILKRLLAESGQYFSLKMLGPEYELSCFLTNEVLRFSSDGELLSPSKYLNLFDAIASQVQEDLAIVVLSGEQDHCASLHLCAPNHWSPEEKVGKSFTEIHKPIAEIEQVNASASQLVRAMISKGPYERFAWGIGDDSRLNHHPSPPVGSLAGRSFRGTEKDLILRIERQSTRGFPELQAALFTIRTYFLPCSELSRDELEALSSALRSMTNASRIYKGVANRFDNIQKAIRKLERSS